MRRIAIAIVTLAVGALAGCQERMTLEEAQAQCTKQGGFLVVIHTQKITAAGIGPDMPSPGDCVSPSKFDVPAPKAPATGN